MQVKGQMIVQKVHHQKTTTCQDQKVTNKINQKSKLMQKLITHNPQLFREIDIDQFDLNTFENYTDLQYVDDFVTPLMYCAHFGLKQICRYLLRNKKVDIDLETKNNRQTPLTVACIRGNYEIVRLFVLAKAQINKPNALNLSPLTAIIFRLADQPISFENTKICFIIAQFLIDHGADINWIVDKKRGLSLLHIFCSIKVKMNNPQKDFNYQIIKFLLQKGANITQKTLQDQTALDLLKHHCNRQKLTSLIQFYITRGPISKIPKHNIKKLGDDYFKIYKLQEQDQVDDQSASQ